MLLVTRNYDTVNQPKGNVYILTVPDILEYSSEKLPEQLLVIQVLNVNLNIVDTIIFNTYTRNSSRISKVYETFIKQLYDIPIQLPQYLIRNGIRTNFISFERVT